MWFVGCAWQIGDYWRGRNIQPAQDRKKSHFVITILVHKTTSIFCKYLQSHCNLSTNNQSLVQFANFMFKIYNYGFWLFHTKKISQKLANFLDLDSPTKLLIMPTKFMWSKNCQLFICKRPVGQDNHRYLGWMARGFK